MSKTLMLELAAPADHVADWNAVRAVSDQGRVRLDDDLVTRIAAALEDAPLSNGQTVFAYVAEDEDPNRSYVGSFGPNLLEPAKLEELRTLLSVSPQATALLDTVIARDLKMLLCGDEHLPAHLKAENEKADMISVNRLSGNMTRTLRRLGIPHVESDIGGSVAFDDFARAFESKEADLDLDPRDDRFRAFIACGRRNGAVTVRWA